MAQLERPPALNDPRFPEWLYRLWKQIEEGAAAPSDEVATNHAALSNLNSTTYSHLTSAQRDSLTSNGNTSLHFHDADRARSSHTGQQTAATISDFTPAVLAVVGQTDNILASQVFGP